MRIYSARYNQKGFTLVEMVITIFLFSLLIMIVSDVFSRAQQAQRRTVALQRMQDDMRFFINKISSAVKSGSIAYNWYAQPGVTISQSGNELLALTTFDGKKLLVKRGKDEQVSCSNNEDEPCSLFMSEDGTTWDQASSDDIRINQLLFFIAPEKDPFSLQEQIDGSLDYNAHAQPKVTMIVAASSRVSGLRGAPPRMTLQTTVSTREYKR
jgi:prepilin-type N-terminal cleavage/methylation domain-containing protein